MVMGIIDAAASTAKMGQELFDKNESNKWVLVGIAVLLLIYFSIVTTRNWCVFFLKIAGSIFGIMGLTFGLLIFDDHPVRPRRRRRNRFF